MKKELGALLILGMLLFIAGCAQGETREERGPAEFRVGTEGLWLWFEPNLPPAWIYDDQPLEVMVRVENRGAYGIGSAGDKLYLSGFDPTIITGISTFGEQIPLLEGKSQYGEGELDAVAFRATIRDLASKHIDVYETRLLVTGCYGYQTIATSNICIDPDPYSISAKQKVCTPQDASVGSGQGAPIAISGIDVEPGKGRTRFRIRITNVGRGDAFKPGTGYLNKCSPYDSQGLSYDEVNYVRLDDVSVAGRSITSSCKPSFDIRLIAGGATIYCELSGIASGSAFISPMTVRLSYGYRYSIFRDLDLRASR